MLMSGCQGRDKTPTLRELKCPQCGEELEIFSTDVSVTCEKCGFTVYNDATSCVQWCQYAKSCVGPEAYEKLMAIAEQNRQQPPAK